METLAQICGLGALIGCLLFLLALVLKAPENETHESWTIHKWLKK